MQPLFSFGVVGKALMLVLGTVLCVRVIARLPEDLREFRAAEDRAERLAIASWWVVTAVVLVILGRIALPMILSLMKVLLAL